MAPVVLRHLVATGLLAVGMGRDILAVAVVVLGVPSRQSEPMAEAPLRLVESVGPVAFLERLEGLAP